MGKRKKSRRRIYIVAFADLELSDRFRFPEPIPLTNKAMDWIKLDEKKPDIYYYTEDTPFDRYIRDTVTDCRYIYRVFNGSARKLTNGKCPTLTASMSTPRNAAALRDEFCIRRLTRKESLKFQGFPPDFYFPNTIKIHDAYKQIGNSVSVPVIKRIAQSIRDVMP